MYKTTGLGLLLSVTLLVATHKSNGGVGSMSYLFKTSFHGKLTNESFAKSTDIFIQNQTDSSIVSKGLSIHDMNNQDTSVQGWNAKVFKGEIPQGSTGSYKVATIDRSNVAAKDTQAIFSLIINLPVIGNVAIETKITSRGMGGLTKNSHLDGIRIMPAPDGYMGDPLAYEQKFADKTKITFTKKIINQDKTTHQISYFIKADIRLDALSAYDNVYCFIKSTIK